MSIRNRFPLSASFFLERIRGSAVCAGGRLGSALPMGLALAGLVLAAQAGTESSSDRASVARPTEVPAPQTPGQSVTPAPTSTRIPTPATAPGEIRPTTLIVYKTPTCGCCGKWIEHLQTAGFRVEATNLPDLTEVKAMNGVPAHLGSCHTALVDGYVIEGHVPASDIRTLLERRPEVAGLAVPGMPLGSPGMEHRDPRRHEAYDVLSFGAGGVQIFSSHQP